MKFDAKKETQQVIDFIKTYYEQNHVSGVILGISGGKDSAVVAALFVKALGKENVIGLTLPCHSEDKDKIDAKKISDYYGFTLLDFDLTNTYDAFQKTLLSLGTFTEQDKLNSDINLKPRLRMSTVYYFAALFSSINKKTYLVAGTSNKCESYVGYFTKGGDSVHDINPIQNFTVDEVIAIGEVLKVPKEVLYKTPSDGLSNKSDEDKLGVSYKDIAKYMEDKNSVDEERRIKIETLHKNNLHKFNIPTYKR